MKAYDYLTEENFGNPARGKVCIITAVHICYPEFETNVPLFRKIYAALPGAISEFSDNNSLATVKEFLRKLDI